MKNIFHPNISIVSLVGNNDKIQKTLDFVLPSPSIKDFGTFDMEPMGEEKTLNKNQK